MPAIKQYAIVAKGGLSAVVITPQSVAANGTVTDGTPITITTVLASIQHELVTEKKEVSAITSARTNTVNVADGFTWSCSVITVDNGSDPEPLETALFSADVFKISWQVGSKTGSRKVRTIYASRGNYSDGAQDKAEMMGTLTFDAVDAGADTYVRALT